VCFVDSTASCDADNHIITFLPVTSPDGAVPAGVVITAGQSELEYEGGFVALHNLLDMSGFGGQGKPGVFITNDSSQQHAARCTVHTCACCSPVGLRCQKFLPFDAVGS